MPLFANLVVQELHKTISKRRFTVVILILAALIAVIAYASWQSDVAAQRVVGASDWRTRLEQRIVSEQNRLQSQTLPVAYKSFLQAEIAEQQYALTVNVSPSTPSAATFARSFMDQGITLLIPLLVAVIAADLVSAEMTEGTIKMLLTRPVTRSQVLASKWVALLLLTAVLVTATGLLSYGISGLLIGYGGLREPLLIGFQVLSNGQVTVTHVHTIAQWAYLLMSYGLGFFSCVAVGTLTFLISTLVRTAASTLGIMMAALIAGSLLTALASQFTLAKYLPMANLSLSGYISGAPAPYPGMTFAFSFTVLFVWSALALVCSFLVFARRDVL